MQKETHQEWELQLIKKYIDSIQSAKQASDLRKIQHLEMNSNHTSTQIQHPDTNKWEIDQQGRARSSEVTASRSHMLDQGPVQ